MIGDIKQAVKKTIPIFFGYIFVGIAFGLLLSKAGYNYIWALFISCAVYSGSLQFILISFLSFPADIISVAVTSLAVSSRHMFYGISFIEQFNKMGAKKWYMIYSLTDETYSVLCSERGNAIAYNKDRVLFFIALLNQLYWIIGSLLGCLIGDMVLFNYTGIEFALTALFAVILIGLIKSAKNCTAAAIGAGCAIACVLIFGPEKFLLPSFISACAILIIFKNYISNYKREKS